ncbi:hypothetical protein [Microbacterium hydrocarbonoxydans]|uniref:hypothetical protein n=1 Tax=Microbacterium hydrocarbonoxydans TaxID=273678 RepID=UPI00203E9E4B|nr:hypothetical protein [Microbacterium hydrocarbonoxydans]MCM3778095.1 hypothetical protein [Microbacterium hydrocarbonoxydans]
MNARTALAAPALIAAGLLALTGCSAYDSLVHKYATTAFDDRSAFEADAEVDASWIPTDATGITVRTSTLEDAADAVILLTSDSPLSDDCREVDRYSAPSWVLDGAPDPYEAETVFACDDWSVIAGDGVWFGWTPNSPEERGATSAG